MTTALKEIYKENGLEEPEMIGNVSQERMDELEKAEQKENGLCEYCKDSLPINPFKKNGKQYCCIDCEYKEKQKKMEETEIITCEYCKEKTSLESALIDENRFFCCEGCIEKYQEKQKREKFQAVELPQDTIQRLTRENEELRQNAKKQYCKNCQETIEEYNLIENLQKENEELKKEIANTSNRVDREEFDKMVEDFYREDDPEQEDDLKSPPGKFVCSMVSENIVKGLREEIEALKEENGFLKTNDASIENQEFCKTVQRQQEEIKKLKQNELTWKQRQDYRSEIDKKDKEIEALKQEKDNLIIENTDLKNKEIDGWEYQEKETFCKCEICGNCGNDRFFSEAENKIVCSRVCIEKWNKIKLKKQEETITSKTAKIHMYIKEVEELKREIETLVIENTDLKAEKELLQKENLAWEDAVIKSDKEIERISNLVNVVAEDNAKFQQYEREIEKLQKDKEYREIVYNENLSIIRKDTTEAKQEIKNLIDKLVSIRSFASAICVLSHINTPVNCLAEEIFDKLKKYYIDPVDSGLNQ